MSDGMTREEQNRKLKAFITCLKCEVSGKPCDDNCPIQYEAGNMGEIIENLEAISKALEQEPKNCNDCLFKKEWEKIGKLLSVVLEKQTEQEPRKGHWIPYLKEGLIVKCSECKSRFTLGYNFCPNCGADMREVDNGNDD